MGLNLMMFTQEIIYLDEFKLLGSHWIALYVNNINITYLDSFGVNIKEIKNFIGNKNILTNINIQFGNV